LIRRLGHVGTAGEETDEGADDEVEEGPHRPIVPGLSDRESGFSTPTGYVPAPRRRSAQVLSLAEREEISRGLAGGLSLRTIARRVRRAPSTISREIVRHGGRKRYRAIRADERAWQWARRPKPCKLATSPLLRELVAVKLAEDWSPEQISGWLARTYPGEQALQVSTETIYRSLVIQARGVLRKELTAHLRSRRTMRRSVHATRKGQGRGGIIDAISIRERPAEVEDRAVPGHWEGDLIAGSANTHCETDHPVPSWAGSPDWSRQRRG